MNKENYLTPDVVVVTIRVRSRILSLSIDKENGDRYNAAQNWDGANDWQ